MTLKSPSKKKHINLKSNIFGKIEINSIYDPFDTVYRMVTVEMSTIAEAEKNNDFGKWLKKVIPEFESERQNWDDPKLSDYIRNSGRLRPNFLRWVSGAYLHISYDLPRVMANNWNATKSAYFVNSGFSFHYHYRSIDTAFSRVTPIALRDKRASGVILSKISNLPGMRLLHDEVARQVDVLRSEAIHNAEHLFHPNTNRLYVEGKMREAAILSIEHVVDWKIWTWDRFNVFRASTFAIYLPFVPIAIDIYYIIILAIIAFGFYIYVLLRDMQLFVMEFSNRLTQYMRIAIHDPENFETYTSRRSAERFQGDIPD